MRRRQQRRMPKGFTLVEVMMAITVLMIGAAAIFTMQRLADSANANSRRVSTALTINRRVLDHLQLQALRWGPEPAASIPWLNQLGAGADWFTPADADDLSSSWDWYGFPVAADRAAYCTEMRLTPLGPGDGFARVEVRTWWHRDGRSGVGNEPSLDIFTCGDDPAAVTAALATARAHTGLGAEYASTVLRRGR